MTKFQFIVLGIFIVFLIAGVVAFATFKGNDAATQLPPITIWGTFPADVFDLYVSKINNTLQQTVVVTYIQKSPDQFASDFVSALARGQGPDVILIPADTILPQEDKLALIPYESLSQRTYLDAFIQEAGVYLSSNGILALPFTVDPLVMYWNRDTFDAAGVASYPRYWDELTALNSKLTSRDQNGNIHKSAVALGEFSNITHARELFATLLFQLGNPITVQDEEGIVTSQLKTSAAVNPAPALEFFTQPINPNSTVYSWNRSLPESKTAFLSGNLATYFGFASELRDLRDKNPNLNFDAAQIPQLRKGGQRATYGRMYGFSITRASQNPQAALQVISLLTAKQYLADLSNSLYLPSVRRDVIGQGSKDPYISIFNEAALVSRTWLDADPAKSTALFGAMANSVTSGQRTTAQAIQDTGDQYDVILRQALR